MACVVHIACPLSLAIPWNHNYTMISVRTSSQIESLKWLCICMCPPVLRSHSEQLCFATPFKRDIPLTKDTRQCPHLVHRHIEPPCETPARPLVHTMLKHWAARHLQTTAPSLCDYCGTPSAPKWFCFHTQKQQTAGVCICHVFIIYVELNLRVSITLCIDEN